MAHRIDLFELDVNLLVKGDSAASRAITLGQQAANADTVSIDVPFTNATVNGQRIAFKNTLDAIIPPTATDDSTAGYEIGSMWIDTVLNQFYVCVDATAAAAVWTPTISAFDLFTDNVSDPTPGVDKAVVYGKDVNGTVRMFARDEDDIISPLTRSCGEISIEQNTADTVISASSADFSNKVQVLVFDTNTPNNQGTTPDHTNDHITIIIPGQYFIHCGISFKNGANDIFSGAVFKNNGATQITTRFSRKIGAGGDVGSVTCSGLATLAAGDTIELWIQNETAADDCIVTDGNIAIFSV